MFIDDRLVVTEERRRGSPHVALPGGGLKRWENVHDGLVREVREETGLLAEPERLLYVAEVVAPYKLQDLNLIFLASIKERLEGRRVGLVDPAAAEGVLPPLLDQIARDAADGWPTVPRWLGNIWQPPA